MTITDKPLVLEASLCNRHRLQRSCEHSAPSQRRSPDPAYVRKMEPPSHSVTVEFTHGASSATIDFRVSQHTQQLFQR